MYAVPQVMTGQPCAASGPDYRCCAPPLSRLARRPAASNGRLLIRPCQSGGSSRPVGTGTQRQDLAAAARCQVDSVQVWLIAHHLHSSDMRLSIKRHGARWQTPLGARPQPAHGQLPRLAMEKRAAQLSSAKQCSRLRQSLESGNSGLRVAALTRTSGSAPPTGIAPLIMTGASQPPVAELMVSRVAALVASSYCSVYLGAQASRWMRFCRGSSTRRPQKSGHKGWQPGAGAMQWLIDASNQQSYLKQKASGNGSSTGYQVLPCR